MRRTVHCGFLLTFKLAVSTASAEQIVLSEPLLSAGQNLAAAMSQIATQAIATDRETDRTKYLDNLFRLQIVAARYQDALVTLAALRALPREIPPAEPAIVNQRWEIYSQSKQLQSTASDTFAAAFARQTAQALERLDGKAAYQLLYTFGTPLDYLEKAWFDALNKQKGKISIPLPDAIDLVRMYLLVSAYREFQPLMAGITAEDDRRRYVIEKDIQVRTPDGATVCALVMRPRDAPERLPSLLNFTIYADPVVKLDDARRTAANGYAAIIGLTRGKACSPDGPVPIEHDGADAAALIGWISRQPWSDGRVGMYGGSYEGFTQWATAKRLPKALKALMPSVSFSPGTDFPMEGNIFLTYAFPWPFYTTDNKTLDDRTYYDSARWDRLRRNWYVSGRAYRDLDKIDGASNPIFDRWITHASYDSYWQSAVPSRQDYRRIVIPVLTTTGYYDSGQIGALSYFVQYQQYNPSAEHYLVIGPYDHRRAQRGTIGPLGTTTTPSLRGYDLDPAAQLDIIGLRYQWFDYVFKGAPKPRILQDQVNYEVMGANVWKHAPSVAGMAARTQRFYLGGASDRYTLDYKPATSALFVTQTVDLTDRTDVERFFPPGPMIDQALDEWPIVDTAPNIANSLMFVSAPFTKAPEVSGLFSGRLEFVANKQDFDFGVTLFEVTAENRYFQLAYVWHRASYAKDRSHRQLLVPGRRTRIAFHAGRLTSRQFQPGSRLAVLLGVIKQPGEQINYGTGKDVSDETIADAGAPLVVQWAGTSFINVPVAGRDH